MQVELKKLNYKNTMKMCTFKDDVAEWSNAPD